jgi:hypothetical protein
VAFEEGCTDWLPEVGLLPPQEPEAEHDVALLLDQETRVLCPCWILEGLALRDKLGAGAGAGELAVTATETVRATFPPAPLQVSV